MSDNKTDIACINNMGYQIVYVQWSGCANFKLGKSDQLMAVCCICPTKENNRSRHHVKGMPLNWN